jgi:hypothetical protein
LWSRRTLWAGWTLQSLWTFLAPTDWDVAGLAADDRVGVDVVEGSAVGFDAAVERGARLVPGGNQRRASAKRQRRDDRDGQQHAAPGSNNAPF